jgi:hypothetical protein
MTDTPPYVLNEKTIPLDGFQVGGYNWGWPYTIENKVATDTLYDEGDWLLHQQGGYYPPAFNAIGSAAFPHRHREFEASWQNSGAGYGMAVNQPNSRLKTLPKVLQISKYDRVQKLGNASILADEQKRAGILFGRNSEVDGKKSKGVFISGAPAGWLESKSIGVLHQGKAF